MNIQSALCMDTHLVGSGGSCVDTDDLVLLRQGISI